MKRTIIFTLFLMLLALPALVKAQVPTPAPTIYKEWALLGESSNHLDISYRIIKCTSVNQVHLFIFNESPTDQTASFTVEITNTNDGQKFTKETSFDAKKAAMYKAECDSDSTFNSLKIDLPSNYDPTNITAKITFKS